MTNDPTILAIETSARVGSVSLGCASKSLETIELPQQRRHAVDLMPAIDSLCSSAGVKPDAIDRIHVSLGPGSFTGLRVGITSAKTMAYLTGCDLYGIDSLQVIAAAAPTKNIDHLAICLNAKRNSAYTGIFENQNNTWVATSAPMLMHWDQLLKRFDKPFALIADLPPLDDLPDHVKYLDPDLAIPHSEPLWNLGEKLAKEQSPISPFELAPLYIRLPEAEELWQAKQERA